MTMSSRIRNAFARAHEQGRAAFIAYLMLGYPDEEASVALAQAIATAGADVLELGIPFSDPLADGATIQHASEIALKNGVTLERCFTLARRIADSIETPFVFMGYYNPFLRMGLADACQRAAASGASGLIIPDLPVEESETLIDACKPHQIAPVFLITPTSPPVRIQRIAQHARDAESGFLYCVSLSGVTGARSELPPELPQFINSVRQSAGDVPLGVGFGVSRPEQAKTIAQIADGVVVGSAILNAYTDAPAGHAIDAASTLVRSLSQALNK